MKKPGQKKLAELHSLLDQIRTLEANYKQYEKAKKKAKEIMEEYSLHEITTHAGSKGILNPRGRSVWNSDKLALYLGEDADKFKKQINYNELKVVDSEEAEPKAAA